MRPLYLIVSAPIIVLSAIYFLLNKRVRHGLYTSRANLSYNHISNPEVNLICYLVVGEDHRYYNHAGFDPIAIFRAISKLFQNKRLEGASTIEQQYVRTCTARYDVSISRKIEEIAIASLLSALENKDVIAYSYLNNAYYGETINGIMSAAENLHFIRTDNIKFISNEAFIISLLKNPFPNTISDAWLRKLESRAFHIQYRYKHSKHAKKISQLVRHWLHQINFLSQR